jgi:hypothetical protein
LADAVIDRHSDPRIGDVDRFDQRPPCRHFRQELARRAQRAARRADSRSQPGPRSVPNATSTSADTAWK